MTKVIADITMSLDGFVTGPDPDLVHGLGHGGEPLHDLGVPATTPSTPSSFVPATEQIGRGGHGPPPLRHRRRPRWLERRRRLRSPGDRKAAVLRRHPHRRRSPGRLTNLDFTFVTDGIRRHDRAGPHRGGGQERRGSWAGATPSRRRSRPGSSNAPPPRLADRPRRGHAAVRRRGPDRDASDRRAGLVDRDAHHLRHSLNPSDSPTRPPGQRRQGMVSCPFGRWCQR